LGILRGLPFCWFMQKAFM